MGGTKQESRQWAEVTTKNKQIMTGTGESTEAVWRIFMGHFETRYGVWCDKVGVSEHPNGAVGSGHCQVIVPL